ncbi:MAG: DUF2442 domain-containing protein [Rubrivivax sp.]
MNPRVVAVSRLPDEYALSVAFDNGEQRRLDLRPLLAYPVFERLRDTAFFALARADHGTVAWPGGIDLDPDMVYLDSVATRQAAAAG